MADMKIIMGGRQYTNTSSNIIQNKKKHTQPHASWNSSLSRTLSLSDMCGEACCSLQGMHTAIAQSKEHHKRVNSTRGKTSSLKLEALHSAYETNKVTCALYRTSNKSISKHGTQNSFRTSAHHPLWISIWAVVLVRRYYSFNKFNQQMRTLGNPQVCLFPGTLAVLKIYPTKNRHSYLVCPCLSLNLKCNESTSSLAALFTLYSSLEVLQSHYLYKKAHRLSTTGCSTQSISSNYDAGVHVQK